VVTVLDEDLIADRSMLREWMGIPKFTTVGFYRVAASPPKILLSEKLFLSYRIFPLDRSRSLTKARL
jgi:hypothetical protein